jgi:prepilin-type N-terminal cleavage/methylation domain-containing protein
MQTSRRLPGRSKQKGFTLIELITTLTIVAILSVYASARTASESEEGIAEASGAYLAVVANASQQHILINFNQYSNNLPVAGVADVLSPTLAELVALGRLTSGFPIAPGSIATRQNVQINITQTGCPGPGCQVTALVCTTTPVTLGGAETRFDLASVMVAAQNGNGGQSLYAAGATIRGPLVNVPNPMGNVEGIVCGSSSVDTALFQRFVTIGDTRDPSLAGNLTVAGTVTANGPAVLNSTLTANGAATINNNLSVTGLISGTNQNLGATNCINMTGANGRAGFGCAVGSDVPAGYAGGVRSADVVASANILASDNPAGFTGSNTNFALVTANNGAGAAEIRTSGRAAADRLVPVGSYTAGTACNDDGAIARRATGTGLVVCQNASWRDLTVTAGVGDACAAEGSTATTAGGVVMFCMGGQYRSFNSVIASATPGASCTTAGSLGMDTLNNNGTLICRANPGTGGGTPRWLRLQDITSNLSFVSSEEVTEDSTINKPACTAGGGMSSIPVVQLVPKSFASSDAGFVFYVENTTSWKVRMRNGAGGLLSGTPYAVAHVYCYYI